MKALKRNFSFLALLLIASLASTGCDKDNSTKADCDALSKKIDTDKAAYLASPTTEKCETVVGDYNEYINNGCPDADSYTNLKNSFRDAHNQCK